VKKGNIHTLSLFDPAPGSLYYGTKGWNLKALLAWVSAAVLGVPGLIGAYHPSWVSTGAKHLYQTGWVVCFAVAMCVYYALCRVLPRQVHPMGRPANTPMIFEQLAESEGYVEGEHRIHLELSTMEGLTSHESSSSRAGSVRETPKADV
jgi:NCS1 family nucleobase:cation symporter-1